METMEKPPNQLLYKEKHKTPSPGGTEKILAQIRRVLP